MSKPKFTAGVLKQAGFNQRYDGMTLGPFIFRHDQLLEKIRKAGLEDIPPDKRKELLDYIDHLPDKEEGVNDLTIALAVCLSAPDDTPAFRWGFEKLTRYIDQIFDAARQMHTDHTPVKQYHEFLDSILLVGDYIKGKFPLCWVTPIIDNLIAGRLADLAMRPDSPIRIAVDLQDGP